MDFKTVVAQITKLFTELNKKQKIIISAATFATIGFIVFLVLYTSSKNSESDGYRTLFSNLSPTDSATVIQQLESDNIPYKLIDEGTIKIPKELVYKERITIAAQGVPKSSKVGFELFDTQNFGETDFAQNIKYLRALEGELAKTIQALNPILDANVKIALPKESVFVEKEVPTTASVVVKLKDGMRLTKKQVTGIKNLVAASIPKLQPKDVKLIDQDGNLIEDDSEDGFSSQDVYTQLKYKSNYEKNLEKKIVKILTPIIGTKERISAKVTVDFDFNQKKIHDEHYDPDSVVRSEQSLEEKKEGANSDAKAGGVPGAISNISPTKPIGNNGNSSQKYEKSSTTTNYEISKKITDIKGEYAKLLKVSAAVIVDGKYEQSKNKKMVYKPLNKKELTTLENIIKRTIGFNKKRGDEVTVSNMQFKSDPTSKKTAVEQTAKIIMPYLPLLKYLLAIILLIIFYKKIISPFSERMLESYEEEAEEDEMEYDNTDETENETLDKYNEAKRKIEKELGLDQEMDEETIKHTIFVDKMRENINEHPEDLAKLIESLLKNDH